MEKDKKLGKMLETVRAKTPLVHNITNYVTVNDCANILIACGASPIMADDIDEVKEITAICSSLNINIGTLNKRTIESMLAAGKEANRLGHPTVLDPTGAGASNLRTQTAHKLIEEIDFSVIKGNISEIKALAAGKGAAKGVDADSADAVNDDNIDGVIALAKSFAEKTGAVIVITGAVDIVADSKKAYVIRNGHKMMSKVSGTGCMLSALIAAYIAANGDDIAIACTAAVCLMGYCGERAFERLNKGEGNLTYKNLLADEIFTVTAEELEKGANYEVY